MCQATADTRESAWEYLHGRPLNYDATPLAPLGIPVIIHNNSSRHKTWDYRGRDDFSAGAALNHYCCQKAIDSKTKALSITETVEFSHQYLTQPSLMPTDRLIHELHPLTSTTHHAPAVNIEHKLLVIYHLHRLFHTWQDTNTTTSPEPNNVPTLTPSDVTHPSQDSPVKNTSHP